MSENDNKTNPTGGDDVSQTSGNIQDLYDPSNSAEDFASTSGPKTTNVPDNTAEPTSAPAENQTTNSTAREGTTQEKAASIANRSTASLPQQAYPNENVDGGPQRSIASQIDNYRAWFPPASALADDIAAPFRQTEGERKGLQRRVHTEVPIIGAGAEAISPLDLNHGPGVGAAKPELHKEESRKRHQDSSPEDTGLILGQEDMGLVKVSDLISQTIPKIGLDSNLRPLPPIPHAPEATIPATQPNFTAAPRRTSNLPRISIDTLNTATTDDRDTLPSALARRPDLVSASLPVSPTTPISASGALTPREVARRERNVRSRWHIPDDESDEEKSAPADAADSPASLQAQGQSQAAEETQGTQKSQEHLTEDPLPSLAEAQSTITIQTPIPTRPVKFKLWRSPEYAPEPLRSNPTYPPISLPQQQYQTLSSQTATPTQSHQPFRSISAPQAYNVEPPRVGTGFDHHRVRAPAPGTPWRTHLFIAPQVLLGGTAEHARIIEAYNAAFDATSEATQTFLSTRYRYPDYTRDEAARRRKLDFEAATGESMSDDAYYALFDLETANDGMISALLEWMQGRTWVKVPFVNRILHQVCRLMFTSAQEEARLRLRFQRDCYTLQDEIDAADENTKMERMRDSWQRMDAAVKRQYNFVTANSDDFRAPPEVRHNCNLDARHWDPLSHRFTSLLRNRQDIEDTIGRQGEVLKEDLGQLGLVYDELEKNSRDTTDYMRKRKEKAVDPELFQSTNQRVLDYARFLNEEVNVEEEVRRATTAKFLEAATRRLQLRDRYALTMDQVAEDLPEPSVPVFLSPQMLDSQEIRPVPHDPMLVPSDRPQAGGSENRSPENFVAPGSVDPSQVPAHPPASPFPMRAGQHAPEPRPNFSNPWQEVELMRPRGSCTRCQMLERELQAKQKDLDESRRVNRAQSAEVEKLKETIKSIQDKDTETAFEHIDDYQQIVRTDLRQALQFILSMLEMHGRRAYDQANVLETSLHFWQTGGSLENVLTELQPLARFVRRLANTVYDIGSQISNQLEQVDCKKEDRLRFLDENARQRRLIQSLEAQIDSLTTQTQQGLEAHANKELELARTIQQQMQAESDRLKEQIQDCQKQLEDLRSETEKRDMDALQTADNSIQDLNDRLKRKEVELGELEAQNRALEERLATTTEKVEALGKAKEERDEQVRNLEKHVKDLQIQLEAKAEAAKWSWKPRPQAGDPNSESQHSDRISQLRTELMEELDRAGSRPYQRFDTEARKVLPGLARGILWPKKSAAANQAPDQGVKVFWRLAAFSRMRGEVVAALERRDFEEASERLNRLQAWNTEMGPWQTEAQTTEVLRTMNFLRSYANLELGKIEGFGAASSERLQVARAFFDEAVSSGDTETHTSWDSLKEHMRYRLDSGEGEPMCECEYKPRICPKHQRGGGARYHNFMEADDPQQAEIELTQDAYNSLREHAQAL
ncbi:uncharacterized protein ColSpa_11129 [Colletotrichum spaethianum]|uniref:Uncharacterized protein n=1 Tax=Colletotrichum spaethianum TaxID=700344 RepID=A0AA37PER3_9PEZI|nr:uncharacterized protein ColSpa_11129 [Colletotrichum spaethianum]GKT50948.1 hypothetical protein ColSpa_11129 [Colletotrichum spaethianum]